MSDNHEIHYYAVRDEKVGLWAMLNPAQNEDDALRAFSGQVNNPESRLHMFSEDFSLWHIGCFDLESGIFYGETQPRHISTAVSVKMPVPENWQEEASDLHARLSELVAELAQIKKEIK